jgi:anti-anti-sigma regulatory factor
MSDLEIAVEALPGQGAVLVYPVGLLTMRNRRRLRTAVLKCLAECPTAVVVDLSDCELVDQLAAAVFVAVRREAAAGPVINVLLCGATGSMAERIKALDPGQPVYPTRHEAVLAIDRAPVVADWRRERFPVAPESTSLAGCLVADACADWNLADLIHPARSVMFELVHAAYVCSPEELRIIVSQRPGGLLLSVRSHVPAGHWDDCALDREPQRGGAKLPTTRTATVTYYRTVIVSDHLNWAYLSFGMA